MNEVRNASGEWNLALLHNTGCTAASIERTSMMTTFDFMLGSMIVGSGGSAESVARVQRIRATVAWVRASCERDGHPAWLVDLVVARVQQAFIAGDFPLVAADVEANEPVLLLGLDAIYWRNDIVR